LLVGHVREQQVRDARRDSLDHASSRSAS
jgi:hypothetical protein